MWFRATPEVLEAIKEAVQRSHRSLSEEVEWRLEMSVHFDKQRAETEALHAAAQAAFADAKATLAKSADILEANRIQALRLAGHRILREVDGTATRALILPISKIEAEAEAMLRSEAIERSVGGFEAPQPGEAERALALAADIRQAVGITDEEHERVQAEKLSRSEIGAVCDMAALRANLERIAREAGFDLPAPDQPSTEATPKKDSAA
jgi:hypothetical protein